MKKLKSISLIETLISLSIVGLSIIALLPVMTVKKSSFDPTKGNSQWQCYGTKNAVPGVYACNDNSLTLQYVQQNNAGAPVLIGTNTHPNSAAGPNQYKPRLVVDGTGFGNRNIYPLYVKDKLNFAGQEVEVGDNNLLWFKNANKNLYINDNNVIVANSDLMSNDATTFSKLNNNATLDIGARNIVSISNSSLEGAPGAQQNVAHEYIHVDSTNNVIGIGQDASRQFQTDGNQNIIVMATNSRVNFPHNVEGNSLYIGNLNSQNDNPSADTGYVIAKKNAGAPFHIHSNISVGNSGTGQITANAFIIASDRNLKDILGKYTKGLNEILQIKPVNFAYKSDEKQTPHVGVIAQDLQKVFPESVSVNRDTGYLSVNTDGVFYALLNSIKALNAKNVELEKKNTELENKIAQLRAIRDRLRAEKGGRDE